jgi:hypothetical protein
VTNNGGVREEIKDSYEEFVATTKLDFKRCTGPPKDHFEKILEVVYPHNPYPIKHKLRDCTMIKRFMTSGAPPGGDEPTRDSRVRVTVLVPKAVEVTTITHCGKDPGNSTPSKTLPTLYAIPYDAGESWQ